MDDLIVEGPEREEVDVKEESEVLADGTIHSTQRVSHHKVKHVTVTHRAESGELQDVYEKDVEVPGTSKEDVYELFDQPPKLVQDVEDIEQVLEDGTKVTKHVVMNRMVHMVKMHHESFDEAHHKTQEDYEIEEVVPGTESAFVAGQDSDYEEEEEEKKKGARRAASTQAQKPSSSSSGGGGASESGAGVSGGGCDGDDNDDDGRSAYPKLVSFVYGTDGSDVDGRDFPRCGPQTTLQVVDDMLAKGHVTLDEGDDNNDGPDLPGDDDDESYTHRVVMKKEVHQKTTVRADGQEETVITEDSQVHQDCEPPEAMRQSMEEIIQHFMHDSPRTPRSVLGHEGDEEADDEGTEV